MVSMSSNGQNGEGNVSLIGSAGNGGNNIVDSGGPSRSGITSSVECNNNNNNVNRNCNMSDSPTWKALQDPSKMNKIRDIVENSTSVSSKCLVDSLLQQVNQLSDVEKCLLYLKLPVGRSPELDPLKQPLNPLGSRSEIQLTITWMKTHLGIDLEVSLPKEEVYNEYKLYCANNDFKPLSTADFGKVMKQVFPSVRARRLGQRGQSKYCHSGLRKNYVLDVPALPDLLNNSSLTENNANNKNLFGLETPLFDECQKASLLVIMEWVEKHFNVKFETLKDLALFLLENKCVDNRSTAAFTLIASDPNAGNTNSAGKHRETQFQLQKRLQEREQKRKLQEQQPGVSRSCPDRPKTRRRSGASRNASGGSGEGRSTSASGGGGGCFTNSKASCAENVEAKASVARNGRHETTKKETVNEIKQNVETKNAVNVLSCIKQEDSASRLAFSSIFIGNEDKGSGENALCHLKPSQKYMRGSSCEDSNPSNNNSTFVKGTTSNSNSTYLNLVLPNVTSATSKNRYKPIQPKVGQCENNNNINNNNINNNINNNNNNNNSAYTNKANNNNKSGISQYSEQSQLLDIRSPLESFSGPHSALIMDQAQTNFSSNNTPSVDQDDFMPSYSSCEVVDIQKSTQLSELRKLLQKNLPGGSASPSCIGIAPVSLGLPDDHTVDLDQDALNSAAIRRKVSFQTSLDGSENSVVTSPVFASNINQVSHNNNSSCTKAYNFTPIPNPSGGGLSQGVSQASSANASPFMSPRNTPLPRSRHNSGQTSSTYVTPRSTPYTPDLALPTGITSENSTPFMSPAPTPIFPRSRHNSSQNMRPHYTPTCRTRHSSGAPSYRHTPYADELSGRRNGNKNRHYSGSIPPSPQSAPLSPHVHDTGGHPLSETLIFHQQIHSAAHIQLPHTSMGNNNNNNNDLRRRHMSAGPTIHYQPQHQPQNQPINYVNSGSIACNDLLSQEVSNVLNNPQHGGGCIPASNVNRPQSVPLPQMLNTSCADMDYAKSHPNTPLVNQPFQFTQDCNLSHHSSYAPTPVPSEYNDFGDYSNLEFDPVLTGDTSGTTNSALESIDASFSGLSSHSDFNSAISDSFCTVPNNVTSIVESSYGDSAGVRYSQCDDSITQSLRNTIDSSCCTAQSNAADKNSIVTHAREVILSAKAEQHHNSQSLMLGGNTSHITLNALNAHTVLGLGISDQGFDHPTSHLEDEFQATLMDFPDQDFNNLVLDVSKD